MKRVNFQVICFIEIAAAFLTACTSQSIPLTTESPTSLNIEILPSSTNTAHPTTTPHPTPPDTATPRPNSVAALPSDFDIPKSCVPTHVISNDRNWFAGDCPLYEELIISNKISGKQIEIRYKEIDPDFPDNFSIHPLSWASDNRYLYFTTQCCNSDDHDVSNGSLYRYDIGNESWSILIRAVYKPFYFFSPDGERFVYLNHYLEDGSFYPEYLEIGMFDVLLNKNKRIVLRNYMGSLEDRTEIKWSKSGNKFAIVLSQVNYGGDSTWLVSSTLIGDFNRWEMELRDDINFHTLFITSEQVP